MNNQNSLTPFEGEKIRKIWHNEEWYFSVVDVIDMLTESASPSHYWSMLKKREKEVVTVCYKLKLKGIDGKSYPTDCANTEGSVKLILSGTTFGKFSTFQKFINKTTRPD